MIINKMNKIFDLYIESIKIFLHVTIKWNELKIQFVYGIINE
jgi:hypothetical protein